MSIYIKLRGGAGKSLVRPGRQQATENKLGICSKYSPRSSINFIARCSNFCKPLKKIRNLSVQPGLRGSNDIRVGKKNGDFALVSSVQGTGGSPKGPDLEKMVGDQVNGSTGRPGSFGLQVTG